jgi:hypothetical protein
MTKEIDIYGVKWQVLFLPHTDIAFNSCEFNGRCNYDDQTICICVGLPFDRTKAIVIHEITHAVHWQMTDKMEIKDAESLCFFVERYAEEIIRLANEVMK